MTKQDFYYLVDEFMVRSAARSGKWHVDGCAEPLICDSYFISRYKEDTLFRFKKNYLTPYNYNVYVDKIKPYLRPLETITINERYFLETTLLKEIIFYTIRSSLTKAFLIDHSFINNDLREWYCNHCFDDNDLIKNGYALEAPEGMYIIQ